ncbi:MAG: hypothetical protein V1809_10960 [Planctomycetota bacterium]
MPPRNPRFYVHRVSRVTAWCLLPVIFLYILTGFTLCGKYGFDRVIPLETARLLHRMFDIPLVILFITHVTASVYLAFWRWGWIRRQPRNSR